MQDQVAAHGSYQEPQPEPKGWPVIVALSAIVLGLALWWWARDTGDNFAWPFFAASLVITVLAAGAWLVDEIRSRRRIATLGDRARATRYTQVITFAIAEGSLDAARSESGVLSALDRSDSALRSLAGFQDLRVIVSAPSTGPAQALCETTWWDRGTLATYEQTRQTVLDILAASPDEVVPGSVQVFDMEVVRDAKQVSVQMGLATAAGLLAVVLVAGFAAGAGLSMFTEETTTAAPAEGKDEPAPGAPVTVTATDNVFDRTSLIALAGQEFDVSLKNRGKVPHNIHFLDKKGGTTLAEGAEGKILKAGESETIKFTVATAGSYYFQCDLHPDQMTGQLTVQ
ncbi:MAG: hypothetical protein DYG91_01470 [Chloroflexi bacterium CFX7]|nr:hypothetical protein [Chloroflexi bacterium CFX7]MCL4230087.1 cupredoxin domain-containing protein [Dehalococcoidia bacterium]